MRMEVSERFVHLQMAIPLVFGLLLPAETVFAQRIMGGARMSLGSTWTRNTYSGGAGARSGMISTTWPPAASSKQFFGGITVGRGFHPFYCRYAPFIYPGITYPPGYVFYSPGLHVSAVNLRSVPWYLGGGLAFPPYDTGGYNGDIDFSLTPRVFSTSRFGSGTHYPPTSHSRINQAARVEFGPNFVRQMSEDSAEPVDFMSIKQQVSEAIKKAPIAREFAPAATDSRPVTTNDRIESQRLQTAGDQALRNADPELARTYYQAAVQAAPNRQTPWLRIAWVWIVQREFAKAAAALNRALIIPNESGAGWLNADKLLYESPKGRSWLTDAGLWPWLQHRPGSADRLLLAAGYQFFLGRTQTAVELMELSHAAGINENSYKALSKVATSRGDNTQPESIRIPANTKESSVNPPNSTSSSIPTKSSEVRVPPSKSQ